MDIEMFFGRFHPLVVHLPIGFIFLGCIFYAFNKYKSIKNANQFIALSFLLGFVSGMVAVGLGWLLADDGLFDGNTLEWHRWLGVGVLASSGLVWYIFQFKPAADAKFQWVAVIIVVVLISLTGHFGGEITHGEGYLTAYAPDRLKNLIGDNSENEMLPEAADSIQIYPKLIYPIFEKKCVSCHNPAVSHGGLDLVNLANMADSADISEWIEAGNSEKSSVFQRVALDKENKRFMPPNGTPLSFRETQLISWWIDAGANFKDTLSNYENDDHLAQLLLAGWDIDIRPKPLYERVSLPKPDSSDLKQLSSLGFKFRSLSAGSSFIDVSFRKALTQQHVEALNKLKEHIVYLDLGGCQINEVDLSSFTGFKNLLKLKLNNTIINDQHIQFVSQLQHLETLNLYNTKVSNNLFALVKDLSYLQSIYLWNSQVTAEAIESFKNDHPDILVDFGVNL